MDITAFLIASTTLSCCVVNSIKDLDDPIIYFDRGHSYFVGIKGERYRLGTPIDSITDPNEDVPQFSGTITNCSSPNFVCRSFSSIVFVVPKRRHSFPAFYRHGVEIYLKRAHNGAISAKARCPRLTRLGCAARSDGGGPAMTYQYSVSSNGIITNFSIQNWDEGHRQVAHQELSLITAKGLRID